MAHRQSQADFAQVVQRSAQLRQHLRADFSHGLPVGRPFGQPSLSQFRPPGQGQMFHPLLTTELPAGVRQQLVWTLLQRKPVSFLIHQIAEQLCWISVSL